MSLSGYPKVIPYTKFENFGIISFSVMLQTDRQTDEVNTWPTQMDSKILPTLTDEVGMGNNQSYTHR